MSFLKNIFGNSNSNKPKETIDRQTANRFVQQLEELGYYKYANQTDIEALRNDLVDAVSEHGILSSIWDDENFLPKDYRYYMCDGETVFEQGGVSEILSDLQRVFDKTGLKIDITDHHEEWNEENGGLDHWITVNGKKYVIFHMFKGYGWGEAVMKLAEILNDQFELQGKDERVYLVNGGNDGYLSVLTEPQYQLIRSMLPDDEWKPLPIPEWSKVMKVDVG